jgi:nickel-dependent lactate racemase
MDVNLLYGKQGKIVELPDDRTNVIRPKEVAPIEDEKSAVNKALRSPIASPPLREIISADDTVAIVFSDITRPMPYRSILPPLIGELSRVPDNQIVFINATGTHRSNKQEELIEILGHAIVDRFRIHQHDAYDEANLINIGNTSNDHEIWVNREYMESSIRILTGFIEPHLFAGFSGGPKAVLAGIAGAKTIFSNHGSKMIGDPKANFTHTKGNPIWEEMLEVASLTNPTFLLNVTQTEDRRITGVFAGGLSQAHEKGVEFVKRTVMIPVDGLFDIVISTAGGYPLDLNMYQSVKGIAVAGNIVKDGGTILLISACEEGLPDYGEYGAIMREADTPRDLLRKIHSPGYSIQDQWDAQIQAQICQRANQHIYSEGLTDEEIHQVFGIPCRDVGHTISALLKEYGSGARIAALPAGALSVPYIKGTEGTSGKQVITRSH